MAHQVIDVVTPYIATPGATNPEVLAAVVRAADGVAAQAMAVLPGQITQVVPPAVAAVLADDPDVRAAMVAQIEELTASDLSLVHTDDARLPQPGVADVAFSMQDDVGHRSWIEVGRDGHPTDHAAGLIADAVGGLLSPAIGSTQAVYAITDQDGRIALAIHADGSVQVPSLRSRDTVVVVERGVQPARWVEVQNIATGDAATITGGDYHSPRLSRDGHTVLLRERLGDGTDIDVAAPLSGAPVVPITTHPRQWVAWGDSMTAYGWYTAALQSLLGAGAQVVNRGIGGQRTQHIAGRQGGIPVPITVPGDTIPAGVTTPITVTCPVRILYRTDTVAASVAGTLAGVRGTLATTGGPSDAASAYTFTPDVAPAAAVPCPAGTPFITDESVAYGSHSAIIWTGRNNITTPIEADTAAMVAHIVALAPRALILGITPATSEPAGTSDHAAIIGQNATLAAAYGDRFIDVHRHLVDNAPAIFTLLGLTPTTADTEALAGDTLPPAFMRDDIHLSQDVFEQVVAPLIYSRMRQKGWA